jgi:hypothetical protein
MKHLKEYNEFIVERRIQPVKGTPFSVYHAGREVSGSLKWVIDSDDEDVLSAYLNDEDQLWYSKGEAEQAVRDWWKENKSLYEAEERTAEADEDLWKSWKELINMTPAQIKKFREEEGKDAGLTQKEAEAAGGIDTGKESAEMLIKMIPIGQTYEAAEKNWTPSMWFWAGKQVSFNSRMIGMKKNMKPPYFYRNGEMTRWLKSLLIWGHIPEGYSFGKKPEKNGNL